MLGWRATPLSAPANNGQSCATNDRQSVICQHRRCRREFVMMIIRIGLSAIGAFVAVLVATDLASGQGETRIVPTPLAAERERGLKPTDMFRECEQCPEMVVMPAGSFMMGSPADERE